MNNKSFDEINKSVIEIIKNYRDSDAKRCFKEIYELTKSYVNIVFYKYRSINQCRDIDICDNKDDLINDAIFGLHRAIFNFDIEHQSKAKFTTYCFNFIRNAIRSACRKSDCYRNIIKPRVISLDNLIENGVYLTRYPSLYNLRVRRNENKDNLGELVKEIALSIRDLNPIDKNIFELAVFEKKGREEISQIVNLSRGKIDHRINYSIHKTINQCIKSFKERKLLNDINEKRTNSNNTNGEFKFTLNDFVKLYGNGFNTFSDFFNEVYRGEK